MDSLWAPRMSHHLMDQAMKQSTHQFHKIFVHISKITVSDNKKRMNVANFINTCTNIYTYIICDKNDSK